MKRVILLVFCGIVSLTFAKESVRGVSEPGSLGAKSREVITSQTSNIICRVSFEEPSGDNQLNLGETGRIHVEVENISSDQIIQPKLEISISSSWNPKSRNSIKELPVTKPGQVQRYSSRIKWDDRLPSGIVTYQVRVRDLLTESIAEPVSISFHIVGEATDGNEFIFVNVDDLIPTVPVQNAEAIAVIIGNQNYQHADIPDVQYGMNDASIMKDYLIRMLGYQEENIIFIQDATKSDFERIFGSSEFYQGKLYNWVKAGMSDIFIYYSGHGAPDPQSNKAFFMPVDSDPDYVRLDGYSLDLFYKNISKIKSKSMTIVIDACFSGGSQEGMLVQNASPVFIEVQTPELSLSANLFTSTLGDQIASWYPKANHSLFTYYFLRGIRGEADINRDRKVTLIEMNRFLDSHVSYMARRLYGREQTPVVRGNKMSVISSY